MSIPLRVLIVEASEDDALLLLRELQDAGYDPTFERVDTATAMSAALAGQTWDVIIADYTIPDFNGLAALALVQERGLDLPFIMVSGVVGEETVVEAMKAGAHDYVMKGNLVRLVPAIERELREAEERRERKRAEQALRESEERFRRLSEATFEGIVIHDTNKILKANETFATMFGYELAETIGMSPLVTIAPESRDVVLKNIFSGYEKPYEVVGLRKDGSTFPVEINGKNFFYQERMHRVAAIRDITDQKRLQKKIHSHNRELSLLNQLIATSAAVPSVEPQEVLETTCRELALAFNTAQAAAALLNEDKTTATIMAEYVAEGQPTTLNDVIPIEDNPMAQYLLTHKAPLAVSDAQNDPRLAPVQDLLRQRGTVSLLLLPLVIKREVVGSLSLGTTEPRHFSADEVSLAWDVADQVAGALARTQLGKELRQLSTAIEQAAESVVITDSEGTILYINPAFERLTGYSRAEAIGQNPRILKSGKQDDAFYQELWTNISAGEVWQGRFVNKKKDGTLYTEEATISPVRNERGTVVNYVAVKRDVTRELKLEEQYRQAQKMEAVSRLTAGIAHDFNNLLTAINGYAALLQDELSPDDPLREMVERILQAGLRATDLIGQLLAFSRRQIIKPEVLNLNTVVANTAKILRPLIEKNIELETNLASNLWPVKVDPAQIEQVIVNLVVNARDAMPTGGKLTIETTNITLDRDDARRQAEVTAGSYVMLTVSDNGIGMSEEIQVHIFEPFFTTKEVGKGTGLGLAAVFGIVKQNGGHISVYSEPGQGTTCRVYLPRATEGVTPSPPAGQVSELSQGTETILLVEDEVVVRELASRVLRQQGYTVLEAANGQEALHLAQTYHKDIHLLLTSLIMPHMDGKALADRLVEIVSPDIKVLFAAGYIDTRLAQHRAQDPSLMFIQKPFSPAALAWKVREVLDK